MAAADKDDPLIAHVTGALPRRSDRRANRRRPAKIKGGAADASPVNAET
ncbi:hypothetical protein AB0K48_48490 [Nonomuraea sp. NPDC055795]